jgi:hypothetical protein
MKHPRDLVLGRNFIDWAWRVAREFVETVEAEYDVVIFCNVSRVHDNPLLLRLSFSSIHGIVHKLDYVVAHTGFEEYYNGPDLAREELVRSLLKLLEEHRKKEKN